MPHLVLLPKKKRREARVFLEPVLWEELSYIADFHSEVFKAMGASEVASRNDVIEAFLHWATECYWEKEIGGRPANPAERAKKVAKYAQDLKSRQK